MKTILPKRMTRFAGYTVAASLLLGAIAIGTAAADTPTGKGAARLLMKPQPAVSASVGHSMSCARCKDEFSAKKDNTARGAIKPMVIVARHLCPGCETKFAVVGHGKAKREVVSHVCASATSRNLNCCSTN